MGSNTKIDWCDATWSPVTGCYHDCSYCYARGIANRFGGHMKDCNRVHTFDKPVHKEEPMYEGFVRVGPVSPYPFDFEPSFHRYKLDEPKHWKKPRTIFVCSMADLFGNWVPNEWIETVFEACNAAPQHRYLFLTKNPARYTKLLTRYTPPNMWFGWSQTGPFTPNLRFEVHHSVNTFVSLEPLLSPVDEVNFQADWMIVGAETGNRKGKVIPKKEWVLKISERCAQRGIPIFMKESLREIMGTDFVQEYPW